MTKRSYNKHGCARSPLYKLWQNIKDRCSNPKNPYFHNYGGIGICMSMEWFGSFAAFAESVGPRPSPAHTIDRVDNLKGYVPGNVRWATRKEQARNMRKNVVLEYLGRRQVLAAWAEEFGFNPSTIWERIFTHGWSIEQALTLPRYSKVRRAS